MVAAYIVYVVFIFGVCCDLSDAPFFLLYVVHVRLFRVAIVFGSMVEDKGMTSMNLQ